MAESLAENFFNRFMAQPDKAAFLRGLADPNANTSEEEWLDFKAGQIPANSGQPARPLSSDRIKTKWSESLSAFANTGGGVLIWGIDCRQVPSPIDASKRIDVANGLQLVADPVALKSELMTLHHTATEPGVVGVKVEAVPDTSGSGGFVVCLIPESPYKPHRAMHVTNYPYYMRVGDDSVVMPHSVLRAMFFPRGHSYIGVEVVVTSWTPNEKDGVIGFAFRITGFGVATARDIYLVLQTESRFSRLNPGEDWIWVTNPQGQYAFECKRPIHPGAVSQVFTAFEKVPIIDSHLKMPAHGVQFRFLIYATDREPYSVEIMLTDVEIVQQVAKAGTSKPGHWHRPGL